MTWSSEHAGTAVGGLKALTIKQPWAWAIVAGHKDVENRSWSTPYRGWIVVHAGGGLDPSGPSHIRRQGHTTPEHPTRSAFIGVVELVGITRQADSATRYLES